MFKDISNFNDTRDYLPILNATLITDLFIIFLLYIGFFKTIFLKKWYIQFNIYAVLADVLILLIGFILTRYFYYKIFKSYSIIKFILLFLGIQIIHDILFYLLFMNIPRGKNKAFDLFKDYAKEVGVGAIIGDSFMVVMIVLLASFISKLSYNANIIILIVTCYFFPYLVYF